MNRKNINRPSLVIGAGGTGVKVLRFIQTMAEDDPEGDLAEMILSKRLRMVAIDTDAKSNDREETLDPQITRMFAHDDLQPELMPHKLRQIKETWIQLDRKAINRAVPMLSQSAGSWEHPENDSFPLRCASDWFPKKTAKGDQITLGHSKLSGAAQWRPLGRLALFLDAVRVYDALHRAISDLEASKNGQDIDVYIVCSLAGGTGSGIFWDLAFFIQMISSELSTHGMFLMGDPFEGVDEAGRIYPNVYAALKEIYYFKNWIRNIKVTYPIGAGKTFDPTKRPSLPFDTVYLFQSFPAGLKVEDRDRATIEYTCFRIAHNLLAHLRCDIHQILDVGANNVDSDASAMSSQAKRGYCFSTSSCMSFPVQSFSGLKNPLKEGIYKWFIDNILQELKSHETQLEFDYDQVSATLNIDYEEKPTRLIAVLSNLNHLIKLMQKQGLEPLKTFLEMDSNKELVEKLAESSSDAISIPASWDEIGVDYAAVIGVIFEKFRNDFKQWRRQSHTHSDNSVNLAEAYIKDLKDRSGPKLVMSEEIILKNISLQPYIAIHLDDMNKKIPWYVLLVLGEKLVKSKIGKAICMYLNQLVDALNDYFDNTKKQRHEYYICYHWNAHLQALKCDLLLEIESMRQDLSKQKEVNEVRRKARIEFNKHLGFKVVELPRLNTLKDLMITPENRTPKNWFHDIATGFHKHLSNVLEDKNMEFDTAFMRTLPQRLEDILFDLNQQSGQNDRPRIYSANFVDVLLLELIEKPGFSHDKDIQIALDLIEVTVDCFLEFFESRINSILTYTSDKGALEQLLWHAKPNIFRSGIRENSINKRHLVTIPYHKRLSREEHERTRHNFNIITQKVFQLEPVISPEPTKRPIIYFEDLFRSADEIAKVHDYYEAYNSIPELRPFYHIQSDVAKYPEILELPSRSSIYCGNHGCSVDVNLVDRRLLFCPHCHDPIWNRCGNESCREDHLYKRIQDIRANPAPGCDHGPHYVPRDCPSCQQDLKTWWWQCSDSKHTRWNPMDKHSCITCVEEFQQGTRKVEDIHRRPDKKGQVCHGCQDQEGCPAIISDNLAIYYREGVNGHETQVFRDLLKQYNKLRPLGPHTCKGGSEHHMLFPTCPIGSDHHLYLNDKRRWTCTRHADLVFFGCGHCDYPIQANSVCPTCPRCLKQLEHCHFCSPTYLKFHPPLPRSYPKRCNHCMNVMTAPSDDIDDFSLAHGLKIPAFCPNLFGCRAGRDPRRTCTELHLGPCRCCQKAGLIPSALLDSIILRCPLCSLILDPENKTRSKVDGESMSEIWKEYKLKRCRICGTIPEEIIHWAKTYKLPDAIHNRIELFIKLCSGPEGVRAYSQPGLEFSLGLAILGEFKKSLDDREVFSNLLEKHKFDIGTFDRDGFNRVLSLFYPGAPIFNVLAERVKGLFNVMPRDLH